jgi:hypothetical protein
MKSIKLIVIVAVLTASFNQTASAQFYFFDKDYYDTPLMFEVGGSLGVMNCLTDVGGRKGNGKPFLKDLNIGNNQFNGSIYLNALYKYAVGIRLEGTFGKIKAYDSILFSVRQTTQGRYERSLQFKSKITEVSVIAEFHPLFIFINWLTRDNEPPRLSPYLAAGVGFFSFNPQAKLNNAWIDLQPLSTEGQGFAEYPDRKVYKLTQLSFPVGAGLKYEVSSRVNLRIEALSRILTTDYLDDLSTRYIDPKVFQKYLSGTQLSNALALNDRRSKTNPEYPINPVGGQRRGDPTDNDAYFTFNIKVGMTFGREKIKHGYTPQRF